MRDICGAAGVPLGSFTNHFRSKEEFAKEILDRYFAHTTELVKAAWDDKSLAPRERLKRYLDIVSGVLADANWNRGCLIGDFRIETASHSKLLRERLQAIFQEWRAPFASCMAEAQAAGEIDATFDAMDLAEFLLASWEGAILRMKVGGFRNNCTTLRRPAGSPEKFHNWLRTFVDFMRTPLVPGYNPERLDRELHLPKPPAPRLATANEG